MMTFQTSDPALYRKMSEPHESQDAGNDAVMAFFKGVAELRKQHRIKDVVMVATVAVDYGSGTGTEAEMMADFMIGNQMAGPILSAWLHAQMKKSQDELIQKLTT